MRSLIALLVCGAALGGFLTLTAIGMAGGGHGSALPLVVFFGLSAFLLLLSEQLWIGAAIYALYAGAFWALRRTTGYAGVIVLTIHYCSVLIVWRGLVFEQTGQDLAKVWKYMPGWLIASALVFAAANIALLWSSIHAIRSDRGPIS